jgi:hypothetical protein
VDAVVNERTLRRVLAGVEGDVVIQAAPGTKVYLACRPVSMCSGFDGLAHRPDKCWIVIRSGIGRSLSAAGERLQEDFVLRRQRTLTVCQAARNQQVRLAARAGEFATGGRFKSPPEAD